MICTKYGDLHNTPLTIEVKDNRIVDLHCDHKELLEDFRAYTSTDENSNRVGEFGIGTNKSPASTAPSVILMPSTPAQTGFPKHTSTASAATSTSGSTVSR